MLRPLGLALASMCLVSTLVAAQAQKEPPSQAQGMEMTCTAEDGQGNCTTVVKPDGTAVAVRVQNAHIGDKVMCNQTSQGMQCTRQEKK